MFFIQKTFSIDFIDPSVPGGRDAKYPFFVTTFTPPIATLFPGVFIIMLSIFSPASSLGFNSAEDRFFNFSFCSGVAFDSMRS